MEENAAEKTEENRVRTKEEEPEPKLSRKTRRALQKEVEGKERSKSNFPDPEAAHKKFMAIMIGLFLLALTVMILMSDHIDFALDGGM